MEREREREKRKNRDRDRDRDRDRQTYEQREFEIRGLMVEKRGRERAGGR